MKRILVIGCALGVVLAISAAYFFFWPATIDAVEPTQAQPTGSALVAKGEYLTKAADCAACHTAPGGRPFAGGRAFKLPFGTIFSSNITPDWVTGIGRWSDAEFVRAVHKGIGKNGEDLYPAFPYTAYALLSTDDVLAIRAYLSTVRPVSLRNNNNTLVFPFNQRYSLRAWKLLFVPTRPWEPSTTHDAPWNRGAYLAEALAHCGECHTPRNLMFATKSGRKYAGAVVDGWKAYNITSDRESGIGSWSDADVAQYLSSGHAPARGSAGGGMGEAIDLSLRHLSSEDIAALTRYLRTIPAQRSELTAKIDHHPATLDHTTAWSPGPARTESIGLQIFASACASCHGWNGTGQQTNHAELLGSAAVNDPSGVNLVRAVLEGVKIGSPGGDNLMPSFAAAYSDAEIAAVSNYVIGHFGGKQGSVTSADVRAARN
ncbi:mono/diheme cytochrome c family protein [Nitrobacteraceae bacterium AZCC 2161]